jgi:NADPH:quinone reductase
MSKDEMRAVAIDRFGGPEVLSVRKMPVPEPRPDQVLVRVESAGVGVWDARERDGMLAKMLGIQPKFPWILGSEGAGRIVAVGDTVGGLREGDVVYGDVWMTDPKDVSTYINPKTGFYAEYTALNADNAWPIPSTIPAEQAGALLIDGATALRGLDDTLALKQDETLMVFGASGGLGHLAVQLGKRLGARVFAIASGKDGVALALRLGADVAVDGHDGDMVALAREFAPDGIDAALVTVAGEAPEKALPAMREGGRVAYPWVNQRPAPKAPSNVRLHGYNGNIDRALVMKLNKLIESGAFEVHLGGTFTLDQAADAYKAVGSHHLGRVAILPG